MGPSQFTAGQVNSLTRPGGWLHHFQVFFKGENCFVLTLLFLHTMMVLSHSTSPLPPAVPAPYLSSLSSKNKGNSTYTFSAHGLIVLSCSIRVPILIILLVSIFALAWRLTENPPNYTCHSVQRRRALLTGWLMVISLMSWTGAMLKISCNHDNPAAVFARLFDGFPQHS